MKGRFFYSKNWDVTRSVQSQFRPDTDPTSPSLAVDRFVFNSFLLRPLLRCKAVDAAYWGLHLVHGAVSQTPILEGTRRYRFTVVARRSRFQVGPRFFKRGLDAQGHVANEVECEQILWESTNIDAEQKSRNVASLVMLRGSIPLFWSHADSVNVSPAVHIHTEFDPVGIASARHFQNIIQRYGSPVVVLNLIRLLPTDHSEARLAEAYRGAVGTVTKILNQRGGEDLDVVPIDREDEDTSSSSASPMHPRRLSSFNPQHTAPQIIYEEFDLLGVEKAVGFDACFKSLCGLSASFLQPTKFHSGRLETDDGTSWRPSAPDDSSRLQEGVIRFNCIDCLDRTNLSMLAVGQEALRLQLAAFEEFPANAPLAVPHLQVAAQVWGDVGDELAASYAGSPAMHRADISSGSEGGWDSTKRSNVTVALERLYNNAFRDLEKQRGMELLVGKFRPKSDRPHIWQLDLFSDTQLIHQDMTQNSSPLSPAAGSTGWCGRTARQLTGCCAAPRGPAEADEEILVPLKETKKAIRSSFAIPRS